MTDFKSIFKRFYKTSQPLPAKLSSTEAFKAKYHAFQRLLEKNNHVLGLMADMEEKMSGEYLFDRHYIDTNWRLISDNVLGIIENLNILSKDKYNQLYKLHDEINKDIEQFSSRRLQIPVSAFTIPIEELKGDMTNIAGGKMAHLGEIKSLLDLPAPDGFAITAYSFKKFMEHNKFSEKINEKLSSLAIENMEELDRVSKEIQDMVIQAEIPEDLENAIKNAVEGLKFKVGTTPHPCPLPQGERELSFISPPLMGGDEGEGEPSTVRVSVRSSAIQEDGEFSFAGQYATFLNVPEDLILQRYKEVVASLFTQRAIFYYKTKGFSEEEMVMAVGVLMMIDAKAGGVIYTSDPNDPENDTVIINAVWGLGKSVVDGSVEPDSYSISKKTGAILEKRIAKQQTMLICNPEGGIKEVNVPDEMKDKPSLTDDEIKTLFSYASILENHYGKPQDIEWAIDHDDQIYVLQSRPLRMLKVEKEKLKVPRRIEKYNILLDKGVIACKGVGYGKAFILRKEEDLKDFPKGAVLVAKHTSTKFVTVMNKASAIITDVGGTTGHMASLTREFQVPAILDAEIATDVIKDGQEITVDAVNCNIYEGRVNELLEYALKKKEPFKDTHLFKTLGNVLKWIVPLNLVDPEYENFKTEYCKTFHDITRFAHETAMAEMFFMGGEHNTEGPQTIALKAGIPVDIRLLNIDGGFKEGINKATAEDILSIPFSAILRGMRTMRWPEPRPADVKGFLGMIAHSASVPEEQLQEMGEKSFAVVSRNYMNFSIRLGYHFSMVEAYVGENLNDNYIKFFFKGGGAAYDRRLRRVRLITEILKKMGFRISIKEDVVDAILTKYKAPTIEEKLEVMGKLTAYTKQLDMVMYNDAVTDMFVEEFVKDHVKKGNRK
ncbi:MAG: PEP/pyruvate-binding domain-containing protein [Thermodesulfovibrionales bacterium]